MARLFQRRLAAPPLRFAGSFIHSIFSGLPARRGAPGRDQSAALLLFINPAFGGSPLFAAD